MIKHVLFLFVFLSVAVFGEQVGPWNVDSLKREVPAVQWLKRDGNVHSLLYAGENYKGQGSQVFAVYASPKTLGEAKEGEKFPAVVLIHGGGGTAFAEWVFLWAKRGYAAIAMDLSGSRPPDLESDPKTGAPVLSGRPPNSIVRLPNGGPNQGHPEKFDTIGSEISDHWPFHAAASVIRAHTLLRSFPEVDSERTAVTGISWGGYTTCLVASLDDRFKAAVPVYGCGYLHEGESVQKPSIDKLGELRAKWVREYDPSSLLPRCRVPIFFVNGTNDVHYPLDSYMKTYLRVSGEKQMRIQVKMAHGHQAGWAPQEIGLFIDSKCRGEKPLAVPGEPRVEGEQVVVPFVSAVPLSRAELHYTVDEGVRSKREWTTVAARVEKGAVVAPKPPQEANTWFVSLTDERGAMVTSGIQFKQP
jgi:cephalosporin-C deacetylase-like acetyl esterase